ncbi:MAG: HDOD domain-containing protein, partial [Nitrospinaceae bacterium]
ESLVAESSRLSSLPEIFFMINEVINDPNSSFGDVARVIGFDASLSVRLLKIVNSPFYSFPNKIETITHAISIVGTEQLRDLALATTMFSTFEGISHEQVDMNSFWRHSLGCGIIARILALHCRQTNSERFFLTGILHDIGRLILLENLPGETFKVLASFQEKDRLLYEIELEHLGFHHGEVGAALCRAWHLSPTLQEVIACHHHPDQAKKFPLETGILHLSNLMATAMGLGTSGDPRVPPLNAGVWDKLGLTLDHLAMLWDQVEPQYTETVDLVLAR